MDDQYRSRSDDDLFADEFEPVDESPVPQQTVPTIVPVTSSLAASRHAARTPPASQARHRMRTKVPRPTSPPSVDTVTATPAQPASELDTASDVPGGTTTTTTTAAAAAPSYTPGSKEKPNPALRLGSGANPRTKLTADELTQKLAKMRIVAAARQQSFAQSQADEAQHAKAMEHDEEVTRVRLAAEAERKKKAASERKELDEERNKNRERKMKAMGAKSGGSWDEGKEEREAEERNRRGASSFRGAHGGVRREERHGGGGLQASRFASTQDTDFFTNGATNSGHESRGGRGRGRGRGRGDAGGRGDRVGAASGPRDVTSKDEFPALPSAKPSKDVGSTQDPVASSVPDLLSPMPPGSSWADEVAALDK